MCSFFFFHASRGWTSSFHTLFPFIKSDHAVQCLRWFHRWINVLRLFIIIFPWMKCTSLLIKNKNAYVFGTRDQGKKHNPKRFERTLKMFPRFMEIQFTLSVKIFDGNRVEKRTRLALCQILWQRYWIETDIYQMIRMNWPKKPFQFKSHKYELLSYGTLILWDIAYQVYYSRSYEFFMSQINRYFVCS